MTEQYSPTSPTPSAFYDPESWSWRTSQASLLSAVPESLDRLPDWGTTSDGALFELRTPERLTAARDGSASLPTPAARDYKDVGENTDYEKIAAKSKLAGVAHLLPTPTVNDSHNHNPPPSQFNRNSLALPALMALLPTPTSVESKVFGPNVDWELRLSNHAMQIASVLMVKPWLDGDEPSDGPHLTQLMIEGCDPDSSNG